MKRRTEAVVLQFEEGGWSDETRWHIIVFFLGTVLFLARRKAAVNIRGHIIFGYHPGWHNNESIRCIHAADSEQFGNLPGRDFCTKIVYNIVLK